MSITLVQRAEAIATAAHLGQFRRDGITPYIVHCRAVADRLTDPIDKAVGWLHDVAEPDCAHRRSAADLFVELASHPEVVAVVDGVTTLTRLESETYEAFILRIKTHRGGRWARAKAADNLANLADSPTDKQIRRYAAALLVLLS